MTVGPVRISGGFVVMAALVYLFDTSGFAPLLVLAASAHELGHFAAIKLLGGRVLRLHLGLVGLRMDYEGRGISYPGEIVIALMGPLMSLLLAYAASAWGKAGGGDPAYYLAGISLVLCVFNLLPAAPLDGGRALYFLLAWLADPTRAERVGCVVTCGTIFVLLVAGTVLLLRSAWNFTILATALWMLLGYCKKGGSKVKYNLQL